MSIFKIYESKLDKKNAHTPNSSIVLFYLKNNWVLF